MKELDLTGAKLLKLWLRIGYYDYQISGEKDICTLVKMCLRSGVCGVGYLSLWALMLCVGIAFLGVIYLMFSFLTLYLPEAYYADVEDIMFGMILLTAVCGATLLIFTIKVLHGNRNFAPEYMKRPIRKLFKKVPSNKATSIKEKKPSQTWIACKEMYTSVKEKTCIKVRL
jgi:hypothetical protein